MDKPESIDFFTKAEIQSNIDRIEELINTGIFYRENSDSPFLKSAFIEVLICLNDLMAKIEKYKISRINFDEDILKANAIENVSDLIRFIRNTVCHIDSKNNYLVPNNIRTSFNIAYGKCNLMQIDNISISSDYDDDVCFFFGQQKIYLHRHIIRAYKEAKIKLQPLL